eukprot:CAMPEP_0206139828 /NCGR_PEP_ID=MMETSP1473-20131121/7467_1 /ASSEMBLY_ACC=CAM_ASM_001109 /TAXON_ID=1461547 /ORGANISM="Stichococcus sp, Strain RCC1054" /LENGTH=576 /DNA_ID=CAMNT_0053533745 /DNA_START=97 /DNA_END=1827 /DNA_ORIENTATION=+
MASATDADAWQWVWRTIIVMVACAVAVLAKRLYVIVRRNAVLRSQLTGPPGSLLLGNILSEPRWLTQRHRLVEEWANHYGPLFHMRLAWIDVVVVSEPSVVKEVLHRRDLDKSAIVYQPVATMMSKAGHSDILSGQTDEEWRLFRKGVAPAFNPVNIRNGFRHITATCAELVEILHATGPDESIDIDQACLCETMDVIGLFGFGQGFEAVKRFGEGGMAELMDIMKRSEMEVERRLSDPLRQYLWYFSPEGHRAARCFTRFQAIMRTLLSEVKERIGSDPPDSDGSLAAHLLRLRDPKSGQKICDERLLPHVGIFFFAGHDTTGHTLAWTLSYVSQYPEVERKVVEELGALGLVASPESPTPRTLRFDDLAQLPYLTAVIKESMRRNPTAGTTTLRIRDDEDIVLSNGLRVPAGTAIWTPLCCVQNSVANWGPDATEFKPERWFDKDVDYMFGSSQQQQGRSRGSANGGAPVAPGKVSASYEMGVVRSASHQAGDEAKSKRFIPFSDGRRDCVGQALAKMNVTAALAILLGNFHFELAPEMGGPDGVRAAEHMAMTLQPEKGIIMKVHPRRGVRHQ